MIVHMVTPGMVRRGLLPVLSGLMVLRRNSVSTFDFTVNGDDDAAARFAKGWRIVVLDPESRDLILSGRASRIKRDRAADGTLTLSISGVCDNDLLARRLTFPDPSRAADQQTADAYWTRRGVASTLMRDLVRLNAGENARAERRRGDGAYLVTDADPLIGSTVSVNTRYKTVLEELQSLALAGGGLNFGVQQTGRDGLRFRIWQPTDRTRMVRLTDSTEAGVAGGVESTSLEETAAAVTYVLVAGQGEGSARTIRVHTSEDEWGTYAEAFRDRRDTDDLAELDQAGLETLSEDGAKASLNVEVFDTPRRRFGQHFHLGDRITVEVDGAPLSDVVNQAEVSWGAEGRRVKLAIGEYAELDSTPAQVTTISRLAAQIRALERG